MTFGLIYTIILTFVSIFELSKVKPHLSFANYQPVSILKPLKGADDNLEENLTSFFELDYPKYELLFGVASKNDPAIPIIKRLIKKYYKVQAKLIVNEYSIGLNPKVNNLEKVYHHSQYGHILISDSNVRVEPEYLQEIMKLMELPKTGLVTSNILGKGAKSLGSIFENLHLNTFIAGNVFLIPKLVKKHIVIGKSMLIKRECLTAIKGFSGFANFLAEDHLIGEEIRKLGYNIYHSNHSITNINQNWPLDRFINRHIRWAKMRMALNVGHYFSEIIANPVFLSFIYFAANLNIVSLFAFILVSLTKIILDMIVDMEMKSDLKWYQYFLIPVKDILIGVIWLVPFINNTIEWRGNKFKITKGTRLVPLH